MQRTDNATMDEIIAGWSGKTGSEDTLGDIAELTDFVSSVLEALISFVNYIKELLGL